jgi:hypothetical protein
MNYSRKAHRFERSSHCSFPEVQLIATSVAGRMAECSSSLISADGTEVVCNPAQRHDTRWCRKPSARVLGGPVGSHGLRSLKVIQYIWNASSSVDQSPSCEADSRSSSQ